MQTHSSYQTLRPTPFRGQWVIYLLTTKDIIARSEIVVKLFPLEIFDPSYASVMHDGSLYLANKKSKLQLSTSVGNRVMYCFSIVQ